MEITLTRPELRSLEKELSPQNSIQPLELELTSQNVRSAYLYALDVCIPLASRPALYFRSINAKRLSWEFKLPEPLCQRVIFNALYDARDLGTVV